MRSQSCSNEYAARARGCITPSQAHQCASPPMRGEHRHRVYQHALHVRLHLPTEKHALITHLAARKECSRRSAARNGCALERGKCTRARIRTGITCVVNASAMIWRFWAAVIVVVACTGRCCVVFSDPPIACNVRG